jgi:hypothetical protein
MTLREEAAAVKRQLKMTVVIFQNDRTHLKKSKRDFQKSKRDFVKLKRDFLRSSTDLSCCWSRNLWFIRMNTPSPLVG